MPKRSNSAASALPSREQVLDFIANATGKVGKREIARAFGIQGGYRIWLKQMLGDLADEGVIDRRRKNVHKAGTLPSVVVADIRSRDRDGEVLAEVEEWDTAEQGPAPKIVIGTPRRQRPGQPAAGIGDRVLLRVERNRDGDRHL